MIIAAMADAQEEDQENEEEASVFVATKDLKEAMAGLFDEDEDEDEEE